MDAHLFKKKKTTPSTSESSSRIRVHRYSEKENAASTSHATNDEEKTRPIKLSNSTRKEVFNCFECGKVFYQRNSLNQHVKTVHASSTYFLCPVCNKNCVTVHGLIRHLKIHTTNGEENVPSTSTVNNPRQMEVSDRGLPGYEFEPSTTKDPPCRAAMHVKSVES
ncbi:hypothetical protein TNCV_678241 [Trichonephila clavipes]|nr:hypothetical protein TNCV_678241 [Trichonephila clavipes]